MYISDLSYFETTEATTIIGGSGFKTDEYKDDDKYGKDGKGGKYDRYKGFIYDGKDGKDGKDKKFDIDFAFPIHPVFPIHPPIYIPKRDKH
jgi:hypothetical protein